MIIILLVIVVTVNKQNDSKSPFQAAINIMVPPKFQVCLFNVKAWFPLPSMEKRVVFREDILKKLSQIFKIKDSETFTETKYLTFM